jgi:polysaccharide deacetylase family protein (PEP-CTERM system associated)
MVLNAFSVDVEEYYHAAIFRNGTQTLRGRRFESRVEQSIDRLLELLRAHQIRGTFFTLGEVAVLHPEMMRRIAAEGHEIASHGDAHEDVYRQTPAEFRADIRRARRKLEDVVSEPVLGYRAPNFSIGAAQSWAYEILAEEGFLYDSSMYPIVHDRYGQPGTPRFPYEIWRSGSSSLLEFPIGTTKVLGRTLPIGGGGLFRLAPYEWFRFGIRQVNTREQQPVMFYLHPWELDPGQPRFPMSWHHRLRHYGGVEKEEGRLSKLIQEFRFGTARDVLEVTGQWAPRVEPAVMSAGQLSDVSSGLELIRSSPQ